MTSPLRVAIVVHGRFYMFDVALALLKLGHDVTVFTNYPAVIAARFGIPRDQVRSYLAHGIGARALFRLFPRGLNGRVERWCNTAFGKWAARQVPRERWDAILCMSGIAEEMFRKLDGSGTLRILHRASSHIRVQQQILSAEAARAKQWVERPSDWIVAREEREYEAADIIHVLSPFALDSFLQSGVTPEKLFLLRLGMDVQHFQAAAPVIEERCRRIAAGERLRILNVGTFCRRKGATDWGEVLRSPAARNFRFRFVGPVAGDAEGLAKSLTPYAEFHPKVPQHDLPREYAWGDVFVLPTLEDGSPAVLSQAMAAGLPLISTPNGSGPLLIDSERTGWVIPVHSPETLLERLNWLDSHRLKLAEAVRAVASGTYNYDWSMTAREAENNIRRWMDRQSAPTQQPGRQP